MKLLFEKSVEGRMIDLIPDCDVPQKEIPVNLARIGRPRLPQLSEIDISRHYTELAKRTHGVNDGMYPLGSCTMKYNPKVNDAMAALPGFTGLHPLQPKTSCGWNSPGNWNTAAALTPPLFRRNGRGAITILNSRTAPSR